MKHLRQFLESKEFYRIPLKKLKTGHYSLSAKINGFQGDFILDTGASTSCVGIIYAFYFKLIGEKSAIKAAGAGATNMQTQLARNNTLLMGDFKISNVDFVLFDLSHVNEALLQVEESAMHGIIGADFLKKHRGVIDYGRNCLYIK